MLEAIQGDVDSSNVLIGTKETDGRFAVIELREMPGTELPFHIHHNEDEFIYILSGKLTVAVGRELHAGSAGASYFLPRGLEHGYAVTSNEARLLIAFVPAGLESFLQEMRDGDEDGIEVLISRAARHGLEITGELRPVADSPGIRA
jgi:quercetin dioxygenase-like cupin family protein